MAPTRPGRSAAPCVTTRHAVCAVRRGLCGVRAPACGLRSRRICPKSRPDRTLATGQRGHGSPGASSGQLTVSLALFRLPPSACSRPTSHLFRACSRRRIGNPPFLQIGPRGRKCFLGSLRLPAQQFVLFKACGTEGEGVPVPHFTGRRNESRRFEISGGRCENFSSDGRAPVCVVLSFSPCRNMCLGDDGMHAESFRSTGHFLRANSSICT